VLTIRGGRSVNVHVPLDLTIGLDEVVRLPRLTSDSHERRNGKRIQNEE
jgi:hypothetical protein